MVETTSNLVGLTGLYMVSHQNHRLCIRFGISPATAEEAAAALESRRSAAASCANLDFGQDEGFPTTLMHNLAGQLRSPRLPFW